MLCNNETLDSPQEAPEDPTGCQADAGAAVCIGEESRKVCREGHSYSGAPVCPSDPTITVHSDASTKAGELC